MKMITILTASLLCAGASAAEKKEAAPVPVARPAGHAAAARTSASTSSGSATADTWLNITVAPGTFYKLTTTSDYTGADHVAVAIECPASTSLQNVSISVFWANSSVPYFAQTDSIAGSGFPLTNMGGAVVPVYGPLLLIEIVNSGTAAVTCDQVTTYAAVH